MATGMSAKKATASGAICAVVCCLICCGLPGLAGIVVLNGTIAQWTEVDGTVVSTRLCDTGGSSSSSSSRDNNDPTYYVTYNYTTVEGSQITAETDYCTNFYPSIGETQPLLYDPDDPTSIVEEDVLDIGLMASKAATGIGFGLAALACCVAVFMCMQPDPPASPQTYQTNTYDTNNAYNNNEYGNQPSSVPATGPAGDIPTPMATYETNNTYNNNEYGNQPSSKPATGPAGDIPTPMATAVPMTPAVVYNGASTTPTSSGPVTYYK